MRQEVYEIIVQLVNEYPNDADLGKMIRSAYLNMKKKEMIEPMPIESTLLRCTKQDCLYNEGFGTCSNIKPKFVLFDNDTYLCCSEHTRYDPY